MIAAGPARVGGRGVDTLPDEVLSIRARDGDSAAFEALLHRYQQQMYALAVRIVGPGGDAEDVTQDAFINAWRKLPAFRGDSKFSTWLYRIVTNQALSHVRRRRPTEPLADDDGRLPAADAYRGPEALAEQAALAAALAGSLAHLPADLRVAWLLREADRCSYEEVASIVGVTGSTVRGRIARARAALAQSMADWR